MQFASIVPREPAQEPRHLPVADRASSSLESEVPLPNLHLAVKYCTGKRANRKKASPEADAPAQPLEVRPDRVSVLTSKR